MHWTQQPYMFVESNHTEVLHKNNMRVGIRPQKKIETRLLFGYVANNNLKQHNQVYIHQLRSYEHNDNVTNLPFILYTCLVG